MYKIWSTLKTRDYRRSSFSSLYFVESKRERKKEDKKKNMIEVTVSAVHFYDLSTPDMMKHKPNGGNLRLTTHDGIFFYRQIYV